MKKLHTVARNILILKEIENILKLLRDRVLLIKGGFLLFSSYSIGRHDYYRRMDDIDFIALDKDIVEIKNVLLVNGYKLCPDGEYVFYNKNNSFVIPIDIHTNLWYMGKNSLEAAVQRKIKITDGKVSACSLPFEEHLFLILVDGLIHYSKKKNTLREDIKYFIGIFGEKINFDAFYKKLDRYHLRGIYEELHRGILREHDITKRLCRKNYLLLHVVSNVDHYTKGFILQLILLPTLYAKIKYLYRKTFPGKNFLKRRYNVQNNANCYFYLVLRPIILFYLFLKNLLLSYLNDKSTRV
jgi:hypothetical protein